MDTAMNLTSKGKSPLSSRTGIWKKKKNNAVFPTIIHQYKIEPQSMYPRTQLSEDSLERNDVKVMMPTATISNIPLPGTVSQEKQTHLSCAAKIDEEYGKGEEEEEVPWMDRFGIRKRMFPFKWLFGSKRNNTAMGKEIQNNFRITDEGNQRPIELNIFPTKQPYIPYALAKAYITKMTKDMHQMQLKYMQTTQKLELIRREKNDYSSKIKTLRGRLEAYQEQVDRKNRSWKDTMKILVEKTDELMQEKDKLLLQVNQGKEKWEKEKSWLLETFAQTLDLLHTHHSVTVQELKATRLALENIQEILKLPNVQKNESLSSEKVIPWTSSAEAEPEFTDAFEKGISKIEDQGNLLLEEKIRRTLELLEKVKQSLQKQESEIVDIIKNGSECGRVDSPQVPTTRLLNFLVNKQGVHQLLQINDEGKIDRQETFKDEQTSIFSCEAIYKDMPEDCERIHQNFSQSMILGK